MRNVKFKKDGGRKVKCEIGNMRCEMRKDGNERGEM